MSAPEPAGRARATRALCLFAAAAALVLSACGPNQHIVLVGRGDYTPPDVIPGETPPPTPRRAAPPRPEPSEPPRYTRAPAVRVWLSCAPAEPVIHVAGPCRIVPREGAARRVASLGPVRVRPAPGGFKLGNDFYKSSGFVIEPEGPTPIRIENSRYPGTLRVLRSGDAITLINALDVETYLRGVLGSEMPASWALEALKAQAVAARTYVLFFCRERAAFEWDVTSTVEDQMYSGGAVQPSVSEAVRQTSGQALLHRNRLFPAFYHSTCGGSTETPGRALGKPEYDFMGSATCAYCAPSKHYTWSGRLSGADLAARLRKEGIAVVAPVREIAPTQVPSDGERAVRIVYGGGDVTLSMIDFRRIAGRSLVRSGRFECRREGGDFVFTGRGFGHGAGMCQYGAKGMADAGRSYREILAHYYGQTRIEKLY